MEPIHNKRIYTRPTLRANRKPAVGKAPEAAPTDADTTQADPSVRAATHYERRSGRDRRDGQLVPRRFLELRSGRDRRRANKLDIKV